MLLKLQNIGKIYNSNDILTVGIRGINLEFDYNEFVTIEGESGSGKSTLLNVIGANDSYEEGELYFNGNETSHYSDTEWEKYRENNIATVFQDFNIIDNLTVLENVELALFRLDDKKERRKVALDLIEKVGLLKQANQRGSKLSGGEKQRTVIARALAKDSPIILADEPTGNLDVKASKEVAKILKDVSKDKLVIVVTHNPEFFEQYATRRVRIFDGKVSSDKMVEKPAPVSDNIYKAPKEYTRLQNFKNTMHIGVLNYKSRPKFTAMMSIALFICAITLFGIIAVFGGQIIKPTTITTDNIGIDGKLILSVGGDEIDRNELDELVNRTNANFFLLDRQMAEFNISINRNNGVKKDHTITCIYDPVHHNVKRGEGLLVIPKSMNHYKSAMVDFLIQSNVGLETINVKEVIDSTDSILYLSNYDLTNNGLRIRAINSNMRFGEVETQVFTFMKDTQSESEAKLQSGEVRVVNSIYYQALNKSIVFEAKPDKTYKIVDDSKKDETVKGIIIEMNAADFDKMFETKKESGQACLFFENDKAARAAAELLPKGFLGMMSTTSLYVQGVGDVFTSNILSYLGLVAVSILFGMLIVVIFMRSVRIYEGDFAVYKTLGISRKTSALSLYIEMALIFLPTLVLLPIVSFITTLIPGWNMTFISFGNYIFIEIMMLFIVEMVAFSFNKSMNSKSIRKSLKRGSK